MILLLWVDLVLFGVVVVGVEIGSWNVLVWVCYWLFGGCFRGSCVWCVW